MILTTRIARGYLSELTNRQFSKDSLVLVGAVASKEPEIKRELRASENISDTFDCILDWEDCCRRWRLPYLATTISAHEFVTSYSLLIVAKGAV